MLDPFAPRVHSGGFGLVAVKLNLEFVTICALAYGQLYPGIRNADAIRYA
jgi:hypothetical protein